MRTVAISLMSLAIATVGVGVSQAQTSASDFEGPIATGPIDYTPSSSAPTASSAVPAIPTAVPLLDLSAPTEPAPPADPQTVETLTVAEAPFDEPDKVIELSDTVTLGSRKVEAGEAGGGLLRTNPDLNRAGRKQLGFSVKF